VNLNLVVLRARKWYSMVNSAGPMKLKRFSRSAVRWTAHCVFYAGLEFGVGADQRLPALVADEAQAGIDLLDGAQISMHRPTMRPCRRR
jgi:hypothetical protein